MRELLTGRNPVEKVSDFALVSPEKQLVELSTQAKFRECTWNSTASTASNEGFAEGRGVLTCTWGFRRFKPTPSTRELPPMPSCLCQRRVDLHMILLLYQIHYAAVP